MQEARRTPQTIMLLEDEPRVACALAYMITTMGYAVIQVNEVGLAKELFKHQEEITAIVADYGLDGEETGLDFLGWAKTHHPSARRILISGLNAGSIQGDVEEICDTFLPKPFDLEQLEDALAIEV